VYFFTKKEGRKSQLTENIAQSFNLSLPKFCKELEGYMLASAAF